MVQGAGTGQPMVQPLDSERQLAQSQCGFSLQSRRPSEVGFHAFNLGQFPSAVGGAERGDRVAQPQGSPRKVGISEAFALSLAQFDKNAQRSIERITRVDDRATSRQGKPKKVQPDTLLESAQLTTCAKRRASRSLRFAEIANRAQSIGQIVKAIRCVLGLTRDFDAPAIIANRGAGPPTDSVAVRQGIERVGLVRRPGEAGRLVKPTGEERLQQLDAESPGAQAI